MVGGFVEQFCKTTNHLDMHGNLAILACLEILASPTNCVDMGIVGELGDSGIFEELRGFVVFACWEGLFPDLFLLLGGVKFVLCFGEIRLRLKSCLRWLFRHLFCNSCGRCALCTLWACSKLCFGGKWLNTSCNNPLQLRAVKLQTLRRPSKQNILGELWPSSQMLDK